MRSSSNSERPETTEGAVLLSLAMWLAVEAGGQIFAHMPQFTGQEERHSNTKTPQSCGETQRLPRVASRAGDAALVAVPMKMTLGIL